MSQAVLATGMAGEWPTPLDEAELSALTEFFGMLARFDAGDRTSALEATSSQTAVGEVTSDALTT